MDESRLRYAEETAIELRRGIECRQEHVAWVDLVTQGCRFEEGKHLALVAVDHLSTRCLAWIG